MKIKDNSKFKNMPFISIDNSGLKSKYMLI